MGGRTDGRTDGPTDGPTDGRTDGRTRLKDAILLGELNRVLHVFSYVKSSIVHPANAKMASNAQNGLDITFNT